jgi:hypothetical protein
MTVEKFEDKWNLRIDHRGLGSIERNGERLKNAREVTIKCVAGELPQVTVTFNASDVAAQIEAAHGELAVAPPFDEEAATGKIAQLRSRLVRLHERAGCGEKPGTAPDACGICRDLMETAP